MSEVLIIDDDVQLCQMLSLAFHHKGHRAAAAHSLHEGLEQAYEVMPDVVFLDVMLPDGNGLEVIPHLKKVPSSPELILMTGNGDVDSAELATRQGAWSYIIKGPSVAPILNALANVLDYRREVTAAPCEIDAEAQGIVGQSPELQRCISLATQAAGSDATVLITGDTGTGKELFARVIHNHSARRNGNFVVVDCAALPDTLVESILFGHTKGAFTGAERNRDGLVRQAHGGTLFLDEVGELPLNLQRPFLRVLQEKRFRPVGSDEEVHSDFRLITATNRSLDAMVRENHFRQDLLYRVRTFELHIPSLKERCDDIERIAAHHIKRICSRYEMEPKRFSDEFLDVMRHYAWPGNVRELVHAVEHAVVSAQQQETLFARHLPEVVRVGGARSLAAEQLKPQEAARQEAAKSRISLKQARDAAADAAERDYLVQLMGMTRGDIEQAREIAQVSRSRLYALLKIHNINHRR